MATTVKESFRQFASNIEITDKQETRVAITRSLVTAALAKSLTFDEDDGPKVIGSWARNTLIRNMQDGDVDLLVPLSYGTYEEWYSAEGTEIVLRRIKSILERDYNDTRITVDVNCVTMAFSHFRLDIVPAFALFDNAYVIPDMQRREWVRTNPFEFAEQITRINKSMNGTFVPMIKMLKAWNKEMGSPLRSYHLENILHHHFQGYGGGYTCSSMSNRFFDRLESYLNLPCLDPATGDRLDTYLDIYGGAKTRANAIEIARRTRLGAALAYNDEVADPKNAIAVWRMLFGKFFPAYG